MTPCIITWPQQPDYCLREYHHLQVPAICTTYNACITLHGEDKHRRKQLPVCQCIHTAEWETWPSHATSTVFSAVWCAALVNFGGCGASIACIYIYIYVCLKDHNWCQAYPSCAYMCSVSAQWSLNCHFHICISCLFLITLRPKLVYQGKICWALPMKYL